MRFIYLFYFISFLACQPDQPQDIRLMTYNIRYNTPADEPNWWENRKEKVASVILKNSPDVIGVQEALTGQITQLDSFLADYDYYGIGRSDGKTKGEYAALFFKKERFNVLDKGTFWLSETPAVAGSVGWDAAMERICSWMHLESVISQKSFYVFNAHFDHVGKEARKKSIELIAKKIQQIAPDAPVIFMGDLNFEPHEPPFSIILKNGFKDSFTNSETECTYTGFAVEGAACNRIDYIFTNNKWRVNSFFIDNENDGIFFPSDHLPVVIDVAF